MILSSPVPTGSDGATLEEPLSGAFQVALDAPSGVPNTVFELLITAIRFRSASFEVVGVTTSGFAGGIGATSFALDRFAATMTVAINGAPTVELAGEGPRDFADVPTIKNLVLSGGGYTLTIFAVPVTGN